MAHHECLKEEDWGRVKTFIDSLNSLKTVLIGIILTILTQVGGFLFLYGSLTNTVKNHDVSISKIFDKLEKIQFIGYAKAEDSNGSKMH